MDNKYLINTVKVCVRALKRNKSKATLAVINKFRLDISHSDLQTDEAKKFVEQMYCPKHLFTACDGQWLQPWDQNLAVSIIIPVYNGEKYLRECINSVLSQQTKFRIELICVNDGSTDCSGDILNEFSIDPRVKIITQSNQGISGARNRGLQEARGKYVLFIDNDDVIAPDFLDCMIKKAEGTNADIVKCGYQILHNGSLGRVSIEHEDCVLGGDTLQEIYAFNGFCWGTLLRRSLFEKIQFPVGYWYEDMVTRLLLYPQCKTFAYIGRALYYYRIHSTNASGTVWNKANPKSLDQYFLTRDCYFIAAHAGFDFSAKLCLAYQYELGLMLYYRTLGLDEKVKQAVFVLACELSDMLEKHDQNYYKNGTLSEQMLAKAFKNRDFSGWNLICKHSAVLF